VTCQFKRDIFAREFLLLHHNNCNICFRQRWTSVSLISYNMLTFIGIYFFKIGPISAMNMQWHSREILIETNKN